MLKSKSLIWTVIVLAGLAATGCAVDDRAPGSSGDDDTSPVSPNLARPSSQPRHCVVEAVAVTPGDPTSAADSAPPPMQCFDSFPAAMFAATRGRVQLSPSATAETLDDETLNAPDAATNTPFILGIEYKDRDFGGDSLIVTDRNPCTTHHGGEIDLGSGSSWNDTISSSKAYSHCNHSYHYVNSGGLGKRHDCGAQCRYIGDEFNDKTSSVVYTQDPLPPGM
jgi:hypothetical protein